MRCARATTAFGIPLFTCRPAVETRSRQRVVASSFHFASRTRYTCIHLYLCAHIRHSRPRPLSTRGSYATGLDHSCRRTWSDYKITDGRYSLYEHLLRTRTEVSLFFFIFCLSYNRYYYHDKYYCIKDVWSFCDRERERSTGGTGRARFRGRTCTGRQQKHGAK